MNFIKSINNKLFHGLMNNKNSLILFISSWIMIMGSNLITPVIPEFMRVFELSEGRAGLIISSFTFPTIIISPMIGSLADKYGRKIFLIAGMFIFGLAGILPAFIKMNYNYLLVSRVFQGIGFASCMPLTIALLGDLYDGNKEVSAQGIRTFFIGIGAFIFPVIGGSLAVFGWNFPFYCYGIALLFTFYIWFKFPEMEALKEKDSKNEVNLIKLIKKEFDILKQPHIFVILILSFTRFSLLFGLRVFVPVLLVRNFNISLPLVGFTLGSMEVLKSLTALFVGFITSKYGLIYPMAFSFLVYGVATLLLPITPILLLIFPIMLILGFGDGIIAPVQKSLITQNVSAQSRAGVVSVLSSVQGIGRTLSPVIIGVILAKTGLVVAFWTLSIVSFISLFSIYMTRRRFNVS